MEIALERQMVEQKSKACFREHGNAQEKDGKWSNELPVVCVGATVGGKTDFHILRCMSALQLLWVVAVTPRHWFFKQASARPRVRPMLVDSLLPTPFAHLALLLESSAEWTYVVSLLVQLIIPWSSPNFARRKPAVLALVAALLSYAMLVMFDVDRVHAPVLCGLSLLLIGSLCDGEDGMKAARIITSGTWLWGGLHKINPGFLSFYSSIADPVLSLALGSDFVGRHHIVLHLLAALTEAGTGLILLLASGALPSQILVSSVGVIMVRASIVFLVSMHALIIPQLLKSRWEINILAWNVQYLFLAVQLWRPWWRSRDHLRNEMRHRGGKVVAASIAVFVLLPSLLVFGLIDPYLGICLYTTNIPVLFVELPAGGTPPSPMTNLYNQWGFLDDMGGMNEPLIPVLTHDGRRIYWRWYALLHAAATGGDGGYPARWSFMRITSAICEQVRATDPSVIDEARFFLELPYTGGTLFRSLWAMMSLVPPPPPPPMLVRKGCHIESEDDWQPVYLPVRVDTSGIVRRDLARQIQISIDESSPLENPVHIYRVGRVGARTTLPELVKMGLLDEPGKPLQVSSWVGGCLLAAQGGTGGHFSYDGDPGDLCALEVWLITHDVS